MMRWRLIPASNDRPVLRAVLLLCVFACVAVAFWWHFERRMATLAHPTLHDKANTISSP